MCLRPPKLGVVRRTSGYKILPPPQKKDGPGQCVESSIPQRLLASQVGTYSVS